MSLLVELCHDASHELCSELSHFFIIRNKCDATGAQTTVLGASVKSAKVAFVRLHTFVQAFEAEFFDEI